MFLGSQFGLCIYLQGRILSLKGYVFYLLKNPKDFPVSANSVNVRRQDGQDLTSSSPSLVRKQLLKQNHIIIPSDVKSQC